MTSRSDLPAAPEVWGPPGAGALRGVQVLELGQYVAGPMVGMLLGDQGASVLKVERPGGDPGRALPAFVTWNRGKRSVVLDLTSGPGVRVAHELIRAADVVVENLRPGVADRLGVGFAAAASLRPDVVYCSLPGYAPESPLRSSPGWDPVIAAQTGVHQVSEADATPLYTPLPLPSMFAAIVAAGAVGAALLARERTGEGQHVEVPLHSAMFTTLGRYAVRVDGTTEVDPRLQPKLPMMHQYRCADGRYVQNHGTFERFVRILLTVGGRPHWVDDAVADLRRAPTPERAALWLRRFEDMFAERTAAEWEEQINEAGGACSQVLTVDEWLASDHARRAELVIDVDDPELGAVSQPGIAPRLRGTPGAIRGPAPRLGDTVAGAPVGPATTPAATVPAGSPAPLPLPLAGIRILDMCIILAGPTCGRTLAEFGADVVKVDDPERPTNIFSSTDVNRGKQSILLDLRTEEGRRVMWELVDEADVLVENYRAGKLDELGFGDEQVRQRRPDIVYASLNAFGYGGPWSGRAGWEQNAQAVTGLQARRGGEGHRPALLTYPINDYGTGLLGAYGVILALLHRQRTGRGQSVDTGLAAAASLLQSRYLLDHRGYERADLGGPGLLGESALSRLYECSDGWLYLHAAAPGAWDRMAAVPELAPVAAQARFASRAGRVAGDAALAGALEAVFRTAARDVWVERFRIAGVPAGAKLSIPDFEAAPEVRAAGLIVTREHPNVGLVQHAGPTARLSRTPMRLGRPTPRFGADTRTVLRALGRSDEEIRRLEAAGVVVTVGS